MLRFSRLFQALDQTNRTSEKIAAMEAYFREAPARDAAYTLFFLTGNRFNRAVKTSAMAAAALEATGVPEWLLGECYEVVGDFSETVALLLPGGETPTDEPLHIVVERWIKPLLKADDAAAGRMLIDAWSRLGREQRFPFNKLVRGNFRVGVNRRLVVRALAAVAGADPAAIAHRLSGKFEPTEAAYNAVVSGNGASDAVSRPFPFCLANQLNDPPEEVLGEAADWQVEYKWDGTRAQILRRADAEGRARTILWSRGEELVTNQFPEIASAAAALPVGTVLDGEVLAWRHDGSNGGDGRALSFNALQTRLNRKNVQASLFDVEGIVYVAFDVLEHEGMDVRGRPLEERRALLETLHRERLAGGGVIKVSPVIGADGWDRVRTVRAAAREDRNAEGLMLKHRRSVYHVGRVVVQARPGVEDLHASKAGMELSPDGEEAPTAGVAAASPDDAGSGEPGGAGGWWKWKLDPYSVDAVLIYAQPGSGKRAGLFTDYTFGVWEDGKLTPFAKAYSGLTNEEIGRVDAFVRNNTVARMGPVRVVKPDLVFEIGFEGIRASDRHRSGVAVRFPRILRWRTDKKPADADTLAFVRELLARHGA